MSTFKIKHDKTKHMVQINTLDETHKKFMNSFQNRRFLLPKKKKKIELLKNELDMLERMDASQYSTSDIKKRSELKTEICNLEEEIYDIENDVSELDYYFKTEDIIMDYYQISDIDDCTLYDDNPELCNKNVNDNLGNADPSSVQINKLDQLNKLNKNKSKPKKISKRRNKRTPCNNQSNILDFFSNNEEVETSRRKTSTETEQETQQHDIQPGHFQKNSPAEFQHETDIADIDYTDSDMEIYDDTDKMVNIDVIIDVLPVKNKAELLDQYMMIIDSEYMCDKKKGSDKIRKCPHCNIEKILMHTDGMYVCQKCGEVEIVIVDSEKPNYKEAVTSDTKPGYPYKRINRWLMSFLIIKVDF